MSYGLRIGFGHFDYEGDDDEEGIDPEDILGEPRTLEGQLYEACERDGPYLVGRAYCIACGRVDLLVVTPLWRKLPSRRLVVRRDVTGAECPHCGARACRPLEIPRPKFNGPG